MQITETRLCVDTYAAHKADTSMFQREFCRLLSNEPAFEGPKLDIGCGGQFPPEFGDFNQRMGIVDGVDPFEKVNEHPGLRNRWNAKFEDAQIPEDGYDLAFAYNVMEHVENANSFFNSLRKVLKPGGAFLALTPNGSHPFAKCVRLVQALGLKDRMTADHDGWNDYPAYYRANRKRDIADAAQQAGFTKLDLFYIPCTGWANYFPRRLRWVPALYDRPLGVPRMRSSSLIAYRLE